MSFSFVLAPLGLKCVASLGECSDEKISTRSAHRNNDVLHRMCDAVQSSIAQIPSTTNAGLNNNDSSLWFVELFVKQNRSTGAVTEAAMVPLTQYLAQRDAVDRSLTAVNQLLSSLTCSSTVAASVIVLYAIVRWRGGKGGFGKNIEKRGRLYARAKRRGETADTRRFARNLQGERIALEDVEGERGERRAVDEVSGDVAERRATALAQRAHDNDVREIVSVRQAIEAESKEVERLVVDAARKGVETIISEIKEKRQRGQ